MRQWWEDNKLIAIIVAALLALIIFGTPGCGVTQLPKLSTVTPEIQTVIKNIGWIQGILIIGVVASLFACFNGAAKLGMPLLISSLVGYGLTSAMLFYARLIAIMSLAGGVGLCGYMIYIKHRALKEIVTGVQRYREENRESKYEHGLDDNLLSEQSKTTEKLVRKIKGKKNDHTKS